jgi:septal ring factor EnvC (AmiA/AmiB activator)
MYTPSIPAAAPPTQFHPHQANQQPWMTAYIKLQESQTEMERIKKELKDSLARNAMMDEVIAEKNQRIEELENELEWIRSRWALQQSYSQMLLSVSGMEGPFDMPKRTDANSTSATAHSTTKLSH